MHVANIRYVGHANVHHRRGPSGERYRFTRTSGQANGRSVEVESVEDARYFDGNNVFEVEWTPLGKMVAEVDRPMSEAEAMLNEWGYREKQEYAKKARDALGIDLAVNQAEDELDEALEDAIDQLQKEVESND